MSDSTPADGSGFGGSPEAAPRSSSTGSRLVYFVLMVWTVTFRMQTILPIEGENWISYSGETPWMFKLSTTNTQDISGSVATVWATCATKSCSVRVGPNVGATNSPVTT